LELIGQGVMMVHGRHLARNDDKGDCLNERFTAHIFWSVYESIVAGRSSCWTEKSLKTEGEEGEGWILLCSVSVFNRQCRLSFSVTGTIDASKRDADKRLF